MNIKRTIINLLVFAQLLFLLSPAAFADSGAPTILSYQGRLANSNGDLLGGSGTAYYFKFSIWDDSVISSGSRLWPSSAPTATTTTVRQGVFNVNIDVLNYNFNTNKNIYLQIEASSNNINFETLSPRQRISSTAFAQISGAVSGIGQSSFGTTTPFANSILSVEATSTLAIPLFIKAALGQIANLFQIQNSSGSNLFSINSSGGIFASSTLNVTGLTNLYSRLKVLDVNSDVNNPQLRLSQSDTNHGELYVDSAGDVRLFSTGGNIRQNDENFWVCSGGGCNVDTPGNKGNIVVENSVIFDNKFKLKQTDASTTIMYDTINNPILEFDEGQ